MNQTGEFHLLQAALGLLLLQVTSLGYLSHCHVKIHFINLEAHRTLNLEKPGKAMAKRLSRFTLVGRDSLCQLLLPLLNQLLNFQRRLGIEIGRANRFQQGMLGRVEKGHLQGLPIMRRGLPGWIGAAREPIDHFLWSAFRFSFSALRF
jgi:hypothetical protein